MSSTPLYPVASPVSAHTIRRIASVLLSMGMGQLGLWLYYCLKNFYGGTRMLVLPVHAGLKFGLAHPQIGQLLASPAGYFSTSSRGDLLYHPTSLADYLLFFTIGDHTVVDALFLAGLSYFLYRALRRLPTCREFSLAASRIIEALGLALLAMFTVNLVFTACVTRVFEAKTQGLFQLTCPASSTHYVVAGLLLTLCANLLRRGQQLQQEADIAH